MPIHAHKANVDKSKVITSAANKQAGNKTGSRFNDNRPEVVGQKWMQQIADKSTLVKSQDTYQLMVDNHAAKTSLDSVIQMKKGKKRDRQKGRDEKEKRLEVSSFNEEEDTVNDVEGKIQAICRSYDLFPSYDFLGDEPLKRKKLAPKEKLVYDKIAQYLEEFSGHPALHDGAKMTLVAAGAPEVLKLYHKYETMYRKEKGNYELLRNSHANMNNFAQQWAWDDSTLTARAECINAKAHVGPEEVEAIKRNLSEVGLCITDLDRGDNVGRDMQGKTKVFDVKSVKLI